MVPKITIADQHEGGEVRKELTRHWPSDGMQALDREELGFKA